MWNIHAWYGRLLMALAIIQGGLGLQLANNYVSYLTGALAAYIVIALLVLSIYAVMSFKHKGSSEAKSRETDSRPAGNSGQETEAVSVSRADTTAA